MLSVEALSSQDEACKRHCPAGSADGPGQADADGQCGQDRGQRHSETVRLVHQLGLHLHIGYACISCVKQKSAVAARLVMTSRMAKLWTDGPLVGTPRRDVLTISSFGTEGCRLCLPDVRSTIVCHYLECLEILHTHIYFKGSIMG